MIRMKHTKKKSLLIKLFVVGLGLGTLGLFCLMGLFIYIASGLPPVREINSQRVEESTKIYDREGKVLLYEIHGNQKRTVIPFTEIPDSIKQATISIEDSDFYKNPAFDWKGILRAIWVDVTRGGALQGGSTITQQLAKNTFLTPERTIIRKLKELVLAWRLEQYYSKDEILDLYLNRVPYGSNAYGIESASQLYFGKSARDLDLNESAMLAALTKAPTYYSPWGNNLKKLIDRKNAVLERMNELGFITEDQAATAQKKELGIAPQSAAGIRAPHFVIYVQDYLNRKYGSAYVQRAGLRVVTSLDWEMQQMAEDAIKTGVKRNSELYGGKNAALVAMDPKTGQVLALVGSADYFDSENEGNFNVAVQGLRQPGSAFKPFAYMTAFEKGFTPDTLLWDVETEFNTTIDEPEKSYKPANFDETFRGPITMKDALAQSINIPAVKTLYLAGAVNTIRNAEKFGLTTLGDRDRFGLTLVLGGGEVKLIELVNAYGVFAAEGMKNDISPVLKVSDKNGVILEEYTSSAKRVIDPQYPRLINDILSDPDLRAPLFTSNLPLTQVRGYQIALKTGTTNNYVDAWSMGYTPSLVAGIWVGNNHREPLQKKGGSILASIPIWHDFFSKAVKKYEPETFNKPEPISADLPILRGEMPPSEPHNILYYLGRLDDSQFKNWEDGVLEWLKTNVFDASRFAAKGDETSLSGGQINIDIVSPKNGEMINGQIMVAANIKSIAPLDKIYLLFNSVVVDQRIDGLTNEYTYQASVSPSPLNPQNLLEIQVTDKSGLQAKQNLILFH
ncbi:MAG: hypothetical protein A2846_02815 [Candidatus Doudnabacteria bacterium RIFCSPHIGHO2_01_FULL_49_9]|nr:MAG: hypothetical protein A2846_02815 [Candidatus Doudnabacteria bacterium RIFCSPHIGHO2_01_FULL_49_9]